MLCDTVLSGRNMERIVGDDARITFPYKVIDKFRLPATVRRQNPGICREIYTEVPLNWNTDNLL